MSDVRSLGQAEILLGVELALELEQLLGREGGPAPASLCPGCSRPRAAATRLAAALPRRSSPAAAAAAELVLAVVRRGAAALRACGHERRHRRNARVRVAPVM